MIGVVNWVRFCIWEESRGCGCLFRVVAYVEKGLVNEVVLYRDLRIVIDEIGRSVSVLLFFCW